MTNSWLCGVQGITLYYIVLVMCCLSVLLIANLHLLIVYRSSVIQNSMSRLMVVSCILPLALAVPVAVRKEIENPGFGSICFVSAKAASAFFFYPLAVVVSLASLMHLGTIVYMIKTKLRANASANVRYSTSFSQTDSQGNPISRKQRRLQTARNISLMLKQQWRPGLFALFLLIIDMSYWLFYFVEAKKLLSVGPNTDWLVQWMTCLGHQAMLSMQSGVLSATSGPAEFKTAGDNAQRACVYVAKPHMPTFAWVAVSELLPAMFGIAVLMIFGCRMELWQDLRSSDGFYDEDSGGHDNPTDPYGSRMNLSLNTTPAVLGGPTLKCSVQHITNTAMGQRSPPYSPAQQQYNLKSTSGGVPPDPSNWPSWPSTYTTTPTSPTSGYLASSPTSPGSGKSLYSSDDIDLLASPSRGSTYRQHKGDVVKEASRVRLGYRQSTMGRPQQFQETPRSTGDNQGSPAALVASPLPSVPRKNSHRI
ncbi:hypothetical protein BGZ74_005983 [Mortierella antarctica]|nr:hypothetical protein BGZ74_005983 [Mortierella antarctica]